MENKRGKDTVWNKEKRFNWKVTNFDRDGKLLTNSMRVELQIPITMKGENDMMIGFSATPAAVVPVGLSRAQHRNVAINLFNDFIKKNADEKQIRKAAKAKALGELFSYSVVIALFVLLAIVAMMCGLVYLWI